MPFAGRPQNVWWDSENDPRSTIWVRSGDALVAVSPAGKILDRGGIVCRGGCRAIWNGKTPDGESGIVLISDPSSTGNERYLMFVSVASCSYVRLLVEISRQDYQDEFTLVKGWPSVRLISGDGFKSEHFSANPDAQDLSHFRR